MKLVLGCMVEISFRNVPPHINSGAHLGPSPNKVIERRAYPRTRDAAAGERCSTPKAMEWRTYPSSPRQPNADASRRSPSFLPSRGCRLPTIVNIKHQTTKTLGLHQQLTCQRQNGSKWLPSRPYRRRCARAVQGCRGEVSFEELRGRQMVRPRGMYMYGLLI
jgi:hypothetical protein